MSNLQLLYNNEEISLPNRDVSANAKYIRMSPRKVRRVLKCIQGRSYKEALMILEFLPYRCCDPIWKVLHSAASNAENNYNLRKRFLYIKSTLVNKGKTLKRFRPRAQGRGYKILKPTCHITITVREYSI
uniref:ribosomal protein L22 n=1 Tax=Haramonas pauciplastida TaxID=478668 RepID=UPI00211442D1|nr:ribosomal protein L22 [Haramonas pauciplastida]UTE94976.1 ribosomal protein L22 [Haramonas pauciplastida]